MFRKTLAYVENKENCDKKRKRWLSISGIDATKLGATPVQAAAVFFNNIMESELTPEQSKQLKAKLLVAVAEGKEFIAAVKAA